MASRQEVFRIPVQSNILYHAAFSPDGTRIALGTLDSAARVYDAATGELLMTLSGHRGGVISAVWSLDGTLMATADSDGSVKLWDALTGQPLSTLYGHSGAVTWPAFSPDGTRLYTPGADGTVRAFLLNLDELVALARSRVTRTLTTEECQQYLHVAACPAQPDQVVPPGG